MKDSQKFYIAGQYELEDLVKNWFGSPGWGRFKKREVAFVVYWPAIKQQRGQYIRRGYILPDTYLDKDLNAALPLAQADPYTDKLVDIFTEQLKTLYPNLIIKYGRGEESDSKVS